jgi:hypothetical protein
MDQQKAMLHELWRKAGRDADPVRIPAKTSAKAIQLRHTLYNAVKEVRKNMENADAALAHALENVTVSFDPEDKSIVVMRQKIASELMGVIAGVLGEAVAQTSEEAAAKESVARVEEMLGKSAPQTAADIYRAHKAKYGDD